MRPIKAAMLALALAIAIPVSAAGAQDVAAAGRAYQSAQRAELGEDWARAAEFYELADSMVESPEALRSALRMRRQAGHGSVAAGHAEALIIRYPDDANTVAFAQSTLEELRASLARLTMTCDTDCRVVVDDVAVTTSRATEHVFYVDPGTHDVAGEFEHGRSEAQSVSVAATESARLEFVGPPPPAPITVVSDDMQGISPGWFIAATVLAVATGIGAGVSGADTLSQRDEYNPNSPTAREAYDSGIAAQNRTNALIGVSSGLALTALVLVFLTDWDGDPEEEVDAEEPTTVGFYGNQDGAFVGIRGAL